MSFGEGEYDSFPSLLAGGVIEVLRERRHESRRICGCETADLGSVGSEVVRWQKGRQVRHGGISREQV